MNYYRLQYDKTNESTAIFDSNDKNVLLDLKLSKLCIILDKDAPGCIKMFGLDEDDVTRVVELEYIHGIISTKESL